MGLKKRKGLVISLVAGIILLSALLVVSVIYNFLGGFYYCRVIEFEKVLGEEQTILVSGNGAFVSACSFSGSLVSDGNIKQPINVQVEVPENPLYLRAKFGITGIDYRIGFMFGYVNWVEAEDGYLYFNQAVSAAGNIGLCNELKLNVQMDLKSSKNYVMYFVVEASESGWNYTVV